MNKIDPAGHDQPRSDSGPLQGKTILVTRARAQSEDITVQLEAFGARVIHFPTIAVVPPESWASVDSAIGKIQQYDWVVFTSANAVQFFMRRLGEKQDVEEAIADKLICAIGPATARAVVAAGAVVQVTASESTGEGALTAIVDYVGGNENVRGLKVLIPRARVARESLPEGLRRLGAHVDAVEAYQTVKPKVQPADVIRVFTETAVDAITFTSSSTVSNFADLAGLKDLSSLLASTLVACIGPVTAETAAAYGIRQIIQPEVYNADELVMCIVKSLGKS